MSGNRTLKTVMILLAGVIILLSCSSHSPKNLVKSFEAAVNSHDVDSVMSFYNEIVTVEFGGVSSAMTEVELRPLAAWDSAVNTIVHFEITNVKGDTVTCIETEVNDWRKAFGIDTVFFDPVVFIFQDGKIRVIKSALTAESVHAMQNAFQKFYSWAYEKRPRKLKELMPDGVPIYSEGSARKWMEILDEWNKGTSF